MKCTHVFVQRELTTREYDRTIVLPSGKNSVEHVIQQLAFEVKADTIRILDRCVTLEAGESVQPITDQDAAYEGDSRIPPRLPEVPARWLSRVRDGDSSGLLALFGARSRFSSALTVAQ